MIARRRLAGEDFTRGTQSRCGSSLIARYSAMVSSDVEQLPLVFVDALDLDVEQRRRIDLDASRSPINRASATLLCCLTARKPLLERGVIGDGSSRSTARIVEHGVAADLAEQGGQASDWIASASGGR